MMKQPFNLIGSFLLALVGCASSSGSGSTGSAPGTRPAQPNLSLGYGIKQFDFGWAAASGATSYKLLEDPEGAGPAPYVQVDTDLSATT